MFHLLYNLFIWKGKALLQWVLNWILLPSHKVAFKMPSAELMSTIGIHLHMNWDQGARFHSAMLWDSKRMQEMSVVW